MRSLHTAGVLQGSRLPVFARLSAPPWMRGGQIVAVLGLTLVVLAAGRSAAAPPAEMSETEREVYLARVHAYFHYAWVQRTDRVNALGAEKSRWELALAAKPQGTALANARARLKAVGDELKPLLTGVPPIPPLAPGRLAKSQFGRLQAEFVQVREVVASEGAAWVIPHLRETSLDLAPQGLKRETVLRADRPLLIRRAPPELLRAGRKLEKLPWVFEVVGVETVPDGAGQNPTFYVLVPLDLTAAQEELQALTRRALDPP